MALDKTFNADARMKENTSREVMIGDKTWHPAKRTGNIAKRIAMLGDPPQSDGTPKALSDAMDYLYQNLAILLVDGEGNHPDYEWLLDELEWDVAQDMLGFLNPEIAAAMATEVAEVGPQGNVPPVAPSVVPMTRSENASAGTAHLTTTSS